MQPAFALAVAHVESRTAELEFRYGPMGRRGTYLGPFGIHRSFRKRWPIDNVWVNVWVGVRALRGRNKRRILRRYNKSYNRAYALAVRRAERRYKKMLADIEKTP